MPMIGRGFGERSILDQDARKATVRATQPSLLMSMTSSTFNWMMQALFDKQLRVKMDFFQSLPLCKRWPRRDVLRLALPFDRADVRRGTTVAKQGEIRKTIDVVIQGQFFVKRNSIQIASVGRGIALECFEAFNGQPCSNTVECSPRRSASLYSVLCSDLMVALRSSHSALALLIEHMETMRRLMDAHYESAAAGIKRRAPEIDQKPLINYMKLHKIAQEQKLQNDTSMKIDRGRSQNSLGLMSLQKKLEKKIQYGGWQSNAQEDFSFPEPFPFVVAIVSDDDVSSTKPNAIETAS